MISMYKDTVISMYKTAKAVYFGCTVYYDFYRI